MITRDDCMSLLVKLEDDGIEKVLINKYMKELLLCKDVPISVLKFIATNRGIEVANFYEMLRKQYNKKKSHLYINIVKESLSEEDALITLSALLTQIILYSNKLQNKTNFLKEVRAEEISRALNDYFKTGNIVLGIAVLQLIKSDLLVLEYIAGKRELTN